MMLNPLFETVTRGGEDDKVCERRHCLGSEAPELACLTVGDIEV